MKRMLHSPVPLKDCKAVTCSCGSEIWEAAIVVKIIPGIMVGSSKDGFSPVDILVCRKCSEVYPDHKKVLYGDPDSPMVN